MMPVMIPLLLIVEGSVALQQTTDSNKITKNLAKLQKTSARAFYSRACDDSVCTQERNKEKKEYSELIGSMQKLNDCLTTPPGLCTSERERTKNSLKSLTGMLVSAFNKQKDAYNSCENSCGKSSVLVAAKEALQPVLSIAYDDAKTAWHQCGDDCDTATTTKDTLDKALKCANGDPHQDACIIDLTSKSVQPDQDDDATKQQTILDALTLIKATANDIAKIVKQ